MSLFEPAATTFGDACDASLGRGDKLDAVAMEASNATALMSIAISLKRIADAMSSPDQHRGFRHYYDSDGKPVTEAK